MSSPTNPQVTWAFPRESKPEAKRESVNSATTTMSTSKGPHTAEPVSASAAGPEPTQPNGTLITTDSSSQASTNTPQQLTTREPTTPEPPTEQSTTTGIKRRAPSHSPPRPAKRLIIPTTFKTRKPSYLSSTDFNKGWLRRKYEETEELRSSRGPVNIWLDYHSGDIFDAPPRTLLIHACNTLGKWGAGIAVEFKKRYPKAFGIYRGYCKWTWDPKTKPVPSGSALLIPPLDGQGHWIGCLFTSARVGRDKDPKTTIIWNTIFAVQDLLQLVENVDTERDFGPESEFWLDSEIGALRMCKINSGRFGVDWETTRGSIRGRTVVPHWRTAIEVWVREGEEHDGEDWTTHGSGGQEQQAITEESFEEESTEDSDD